MILTKHIIRCLGVEEEDVNKIKRKIKDQEACRI